MHHESAHDGCLFLLVSQFGQCVLNRGPNDMLRKGIRVLATEVVCATMETLALRTKAMLLQLQVNPGPSSSSEVIEIITMVANHTEVQQIRTALQLIVTGSYLFDIRLERFEQEVGDIKCDIIMKVEELQALKERVQTLSLSVPSHVMVSNFQSEPHLRKNLLKSPARA